MIDSLLPTEHTDRNKLVKLYYEHNYYRRQGHHSGTILEQFLHFDDEFRRPMERQFSKIILYHLLVLFVDARTARNTINVFRGTFERRDKCNARVNIITRSSELWRWHTTFDNPRWGRATDATVSRVRPAFHDTVHPPPGYTCDQPRPTHDSHKPVIIRVYQEK